MSSGKFAPIALGILFLAAILVGCASSPEPVTADEFIAAAEALSFEVYESPADEIGHLAEVVTSSLTASRGTASVIFDTCIDEESARIVFDFFSNGVEELFASPRSERIDNRLTWNFHERRSPTALTIAIRVDNTVLG
ncbi:MAG: hypothetical protein FWE48_06615, partial [Coriobacteriia bacterium]|nr:hypothetical protein [Coriobacteriia bacterium]